MTVELLVVCHMRCPVATTVMLPSEKDVVVVVVFAWNVTRYFVLNVYQIKVFAQGALSVKTNNTKPMGTRCSQKRCLYLR